MDRIWYIDFARGLSLIAMLIFNYAFTLKFFGLLNLSSEFFWSMFPLCVAASFVFISGVSNYISNTHNSKKHIFLRGARIFVIGVGITLATFLTFPRYTIYFGILHLIGLSAMLSPFLARFGKFNIILGLTILAIGVSGISTSSPLLLWLLNYNGFSSFDYEPVIPWFGIFALGFGTSALLSRKIRKPRHASQPVFVKPITFLGRNTLLIYLLHQPILFGVLMLLGLI
jgi:uncharacterized membrane protein